MSNSTRVAFVGLGAIGLPMAQSIHRAGLDVVGVEPAPAGRTRARDAGLQVVDNISAINDAECVVVMVATGAQLSAVADLAISSGVAKGRTWIIMSTVGPTSVREVAAQLVSAGARVVDAPVSGGIARAGTGELTLFVSGASSEVEAVSAVLGAMGTVHLVGANPGDGQSVKVINQHLCAVHIVAAGEALALAEQLDLDAAFVLKTISQGAAASFMLDDRGPRMLQKDAPVRSQIGIFVKDTGLVDEAAAAAGIELPLLHAARDKFLAAAELGLTTSDDSSVIQTYRTTSPKE